MNIKPQKQYQQDRFSSWRAVAAIAVLLLLWASALAIGALRYDSNFWRASVIVGSVALFVTFWLIVLKSRRPA